MTKITCLILIICLLFRFRNHYFNRRPHHYYDFAKNTTTPPMLATLSSTSYLDYQNLCQNDFINHDLVGSCYCMRVQNHLLTSIL